MYKTYILGACFLRSLKFILIWVFICCMLFLELKTIILEEPV